MTVGEKIQYYRKKIGFSQEELGKQLFVSRQTVSLWEMDKTMPTIDNLQRLSEIFETSVDDILSSEVPLFETCPAETEKYVFDYSNADLNEILSKKAFADSMKVVRFFLFWTIAFLFIPRINGSQPLFDIALGVLFMGMFTHVRKYLQERKLARMLVEALRTSTYYYSVYEDRFVVDVVKNNEIRRSYKVCFSDVEKVLTNDKYMTIQLATESYTIKKSILKENSVLYSLQAQVAKRNELKPLSGALTTWSLLLAVLSCVSVFCGLAVSVALKGGVKNAWGIFLFLLAPVASAVYGFYLKKRRYKYKMNVIVGVVMAALCIYVIFTLNF